MTCENTPEVLVDITRYEVSVLPADDINRRHHVLYVDRTRRGTWIVNDGHGGYDIDGDWAPGLAVAHEFADYDDALDLARRLAPNLAANGRTAAEVHRQGLPANAGGPAEPGRAPGVEPTVAVTLSARPHPENSAQQ